MVSEFLIGRLIEYIVFLKGMKDIGDETAVGLEVRIKGDLGKGA